MKVNCLIFHVLIAVTVLSLASCTPTPAPIEPILPPAEPTIPPETATAGPFNVVKTTPTKSVGQEEEIRLPNCAGSAALTYIFSSSQTVQQKVTRGGTFTFSGGVEASIPEVVKAEIKAAVEDTYQNELQRIQELVSTITMMAQPQSDITYVIQWEDSTYSSIVTFDYSGKSFTVPYVYVLSEPKLSNSYATACQIALAPTNPPAPTLPVPTPSVQTPEGFLRYYFSLVTDGNDYSLAWSLLTPKFQKANDPGGYSDYVDFWKTIKQVDLNNIQVNPVSNISADCQLDATFHTLSGITDNETLKYHLVYDQGKQTWMFDSH